MLDLKKVRENPEAVRRAYESRGGRYVPALDELIRIDSECRKSLTEIEGLRSQQNAAAKKIGALKAGRHDEAGALGQAEDLKRVLKGREDGLAPLQARLRELSLGIPNIPDASVPPGRSPSDNKVIRVSGSPRAFDFNPRDHHELGEGLGILDFGRAAKLAGSRFALLCGKGAALERALISFMLDIQTKENGYKEFFPPFFATAETLTASGHLPKFEEELYKIHNRDSGPDLYLIPTAEVPLINLHRGEVIEESRLPLAYAAYTACFRSEAGSYGRDVRGLIRNHQFNKVELVRYAIPERSMEELEILVRHAGGVLERLGLAYRVLELCAADLGFSSAKTYDLEVWMAGENQWREISSCSNCLDFQSRRADIKIKRHGGKKEFAHLLNGSGVAIGRCLAAILENYQRPDGGVEVPQALRRYTGFDAITK